MSDPMPPAAVLAGGLGTRIRPVGGPVPKVLLPVEGRPFLHHLLEYLGREGVTRVVLCLGHEADAVLDAARSRTPAGMELAPSRENEPLGTAGAIRLALGELPSRFFILNGDTLLEGPLGSLLDLHRRREADLTLSLTRSERAAEKGTVRIAPDGAVLQFAEKTTEGTGLINAGVYVAEASLFEDAAAGPLSLERDLIPQAVASGKRVLGSVVKGVFVDIGLPEDYLAVKDRLPRNRRRS